MAGLEIYRLGWHLVCVVGLSSVVLGRVGSCWVVLDCVGLVWVGLS